MLTIGDIRKAAATRYGTRILSDGVGGYEVLAPPGQRWIDAGAQCYVLALNEMDLNEQQDAIQCCLDTIAGGYEPFPPEKPFDPTAADRILARLKAEENLDA